jgi:hypothetical protein
MTNSLPFSKATNDANQAHIAARSLVITLGIMIFVLSAILALMGMLANSFGSGDLRTVGLIVFTVILAVQSCVLMYQNKRADNYLSRVLACVLILLMPAMIFYEVITREKFFLESFGLVLAISIAGCLWLWLLLIRKA